MDGAGSLAPKTAGRCIVQDATPHQPPPISGVAGSLGRSGSRMAAWQTHTRERLVEGAHRR